MEFMSLFKRKEQPFWRNGESYYQRKIKDLERALIRLRADEELAHHKLDEKIMRENILSNGRITIMEFVRNYLETKKVSGEVNPERPYLNLLETSVWLFSHPDFQEGLKGLIEAEERKINAGISKDKSHRKTTIVTGLSICLAAFGMAGAYISKAMYDRIYLQPTLEKMVEEDMSIRREVVAKAVLDRRTDEQIQSLITETSNTLESLQQQVFSSEEAYAAYQDRQDVEMLDLKQNIDKLTSKFNFLLERQSAIETVIAARLKAIEDSTAIEKVRIKYLTENVNKANRDKERLYQRIEHFEIYESSKAQMKEFLAELKLRE